MNYYKNNDIYYCKYNKISRQIMDIQTSSTSTSSTNQSFNFAKCSVVKSLGRRLSSMVRGKKLTTDEINKIDFGTLYNNKEKILETLRNRIFNKDNPNSTSEELKNKFSKNALQHLLMSLNKNDARNFVQLQRVFGKSHSFALEQAKNIVLDALTKKVADMPHDEVKKTFPAFERELRKNCEQYIQSLPIENLESLEKKLDVEPLTSKAKQTLFKEHLKLRLSVAKLEQAKEITRLNQKKILQDSLKKREETKTEEVAIIHNRVHMSRKTPIRLVMEDFSSSDDESK